MRLVSYNIQFGRGKDGRCDLARVAREIAEADIIALQEVDRYWSRSENCDQVAELAQLLPDHHWVYGPGLDLDAAFRDDDGRLHNRRRQFGNLLMARRPILSARTHLLPKHDLYRQLSLQRTALEGVIDCPRGPVRIYSVHLAHVSEPERQAQIARLLDIHRAAPSEGGARTGPGEIWDADGPPPPMPADALLLGDFNMTPETAGYALIAGPDDPKYGRIARRDGFVDAWLMAGDDPQGGHTKLEPSRQRRIDYAFVSAGLAERVRAVRVDTDAMGSDHQPLWLEIDL